MSIIDPYAPTVPDQSMLNEVKYAARDFASMADDILRRMKIEYGEQYNDYESTAVAMMLRDIVCWAHSQIQWGMDRTASDIYLKTARTASSASAIVEQNGYKMSPATSSGGTVNLTFETGTVSGFEMKDRWKYQGPNGLIFESYATKNVASPLSAGDTISVDIRQGETKIATFTSSGKKNQIYKLTGVSTGQYLANMATEIWVDGSLWTEKDFLEFSTTNIYEINYLADPPTIRFGDGIAGNIPPKTAEIKIRYVVIDGEIGNVREDSIAGSIDTLYIGGSVVTFTVTNPSRTSGGTNPESIERAKRLAPLSFAARGAAITQSDYEALAESFYSSTYGRPSRVYAHSPRTSYSDAVFNVMLTEVSDLLAEYVELVSGTESDLVAAGDGLNLIIASLTVSVVAMDALRVSLDTGISSAISTGTGARNSAMTANISAGNSNEKAIEAASNIDALIAWINASTSIPAGSKTVLLEGGGGVVGLYDTKDAVNIAKEEAASAKNKSNEVIQAMNQVLDTHLSGALSGITGTMVDEISSISSDVSSFSDTVNNSSVGIIAMVGELSGSSVVLQGDISSVADQMRSRIADIFDDDCQSNYVQVPILSMDMNGEYIAPSIGLITSLQQYLNTVKEVTQLVEVVDGSGILVAADILADIEIYPAYVQSEVKSQAEKVILRMLKGRNFSDPLYLSDLYLNIKESSSGIKRCNVEITGPVASPSVIIGGNLVPGDNKIIVAGNVTVNVSVAMA